MTDCIHGLDVEHCDSCSSPTSAGPAVRPSASGARRFALVHVPALDPDTFLHLNREGDRWKIRRYASRHRAPEVLAGSAAPGRGTHDLRAVSITQEIGYPASTTPGGVSVEDAEYWAGEIEQANARHLPAE